MRWIRYYCAMDKGTQDLNFCLKIVDKAYFNTRPLGCLRMPAI